MHAKARGELPDVQVVTGLRRQMRAELAEEFLQRKVLAADPALTAAQLTSLANVLLRAAVKAGGEHARA
jgi:hypothetical protein